MVFKKAITAGKEFITDFDMFGKTISFTYKGKEEFQTFFGGFVSVAIRIIMIMYIWLQLSILIFKKDTQTSTNTLVKDLVNDKDTINMADTDFNVALAINSDINLLSDETYLSLEIFMVYDYINGTTESIDITTQQWGSNGFDYSDSDLYTKYGLSDYICSADKNLYVQGNTFADTYKYFEFRITKCTNGTIVGVTCQDEATIEAALEDTFIDIVIINTYFDFEDYNSPVKSYIDDRYKYSVVYGYKKQINFYLQANEAEYNDDVFQYTPDGTEKNFISVNRVTQDLVDSGDEILTSIYFVKDYNYMKYSRSVFSLLEMFGNIGGLFEILEVAGSFLVGCFAQRMFDYSRVSSFYLVDTTNDDDDLSKDEGESDDIKLKGKLDNEPNTSKELVDEEIKASSPVNSGNKVDTQPAKDLSILNKMSKSK